MAPVPDADWRKGASLQPVRTAVVGASGYSGQELLRYLSRHPAFQISAVTSRQQAGERLSKAVSGLPPDLANLEFVHLVAGPDLAGRADVFFLALPHGAAAPYAQALHRAGKLVIDLSADFRTHDPATYREFYGAEHPVPELLKEAVYGLPEIHREELKTARLIASPGCFPTSILLPLLPFVKAHAVDLTSICVNSISGVSGAGRKLELRLLFGEASDNMYAYGAPQHRHLGEIEQELSQVAGATVRVTFVPHVAPLHRGMITTITAALAMPLDQAAAEKILRTTYTSEPFVELLSAPDFPEVRAVAHSNRIRVSARVDDRTNRLLLFSALDNLGKGAASQAIQAANLACGFPETAGLAG